MSSYEEANEEHETIERTADGKLLVLQRRGYPPLQYGDSASCFRLASPETIMWLSNAASSGVVGNLAYDALKQLIQKARRGHRNSTPKTNDEENDELNGTSGPHFSQAEVPDLLFIREVTTSLPYLPPESPDASPIKPDPDLRDDLVELAYDVIARFRQLKHEGSGRPVSEIDVFLTENKTWTVEIRELRIAESKIVEIDLSDDMRGMRDQTNIEGIEGFPVKIWGHPIEGPLDD